MIVFLRLFASIVLIMAVISFWINNISLTQFMATVGVCIIVMSLSEEHFK